MVPQYPTNHGVFLLYNDHFGVGVLGVTHRLKETPISLGFVVALPQRISGEPTRSWATRPHWPILVGFFRKRIPMEISSNHRLVGGWTNPFEPYESKWESSPIFGVNMKNIWNHPASISVKLGVIFFMDFHSYVLSFFDMFPKIHPNCGL